MHGYAISSTRPKGWSARDRATISLTFVFGHTRGAADVVRGHLAFAAGLANFVAHALEVLDLTAGDQHRRSVRRELLGDRLADSGSAAGHNRNFAFDTEWI